jgi:hypothetical protein
LFGGLGLLPIKLDLHHLEQQGYVLVVKVAITLEGGDLLA